MRRLEISDILTEALWIWGILGMGMVFSWKSWMRDPIGSLIDLYEGLFCGIFYI